jgi:mannose-6-phosphate isomerase
VGKARQSKPGPFQAMDRDLKFARTEAEALFFGLAVETVDKTHRPWGGFIKFRQESLDAFRNVYWSYGLAEQWKNDIKEVWDRMIAKHGGKWLDAKLLLIAPGQRLSLQYHERRGEFWRVIEGPVLVTVGTREDAVSDVALRSGDVIRIKPGQWHRAEALGSGWAIIAEFWEHTQEVPKGTDPEDDLKRLHDDFLRVNVRVTFPKGVAVIGDAFRRWPQLKSIAPTA